MLCRRSLPVVFLAFAFAILTVGSAAAADSERKFDRETSRRAQSGSTRTTRVIVRLKAGQELPAEYAQYVRRDRLNIVNGVVLDVPESTLSGLAAQASVDGVSSDRRVQAHNFRTSVSSGAFFVRQFMGATGAGVGVAILDSGITTYHDDFRNRRGMWRDYPYGDQRVAYFRDFVNGRTLPYDDNGHGTHVAGTIAGNGYDSRGERAGMAPDASIIALKVLDANGQGTVSNVIAALNWVAANAATYNIRIVNLSVGAAVLESFNTDPLTLATQALVKQGIVVVAAAGNFGKDAAGHKLWGGITAPGNAPWVLTVGASSSKGTYSRKDDEHASFSSRGPTAFNYRAKPDLLAGGVGIVSTSAPESTYYANFPQYRVAGSFSQSSTSPYFVLSGTSQAAPDVSGAIALMLQTNPSLTPNLVKAILQYTAEERLGYKALEQGAGFLNTFGAVRLARFYAQPHAAGDRVPVEPIWSRHIIWGNHELSKGFILPGANAWNLTVDWGSAKTLGSDGDNIVWGTTCASCDGDNIVWGTSDGDNIVWGTAGDGDNIVWGTNDGDNIVWGTSGDGDNIVWGTSGDGDNIVWGTDCGGADCADNIIWGTAGDGDNIVWGTGNEGDNIVWGTNDGDNIIWGTASDGDNIVWGTAGDGDNIVWGTGDGDNIVWGTSDGDNIVWGTGDGDNIIWGTGDGDNIVWGTPSDGDNIVWGTPSDGDNIVWGTAFHAGDPIPSNFWYRWFLNRLNDKRWIQLEFGGQIEH